MHVLQNCDEITSIKDYSRAKRIEEEIVKT